MKSVDDILKIKATVLYILGRMPEGVDYIHLFKIMYFAQQRHLVTYGMPIMADSFCALKHGPVPSITYAVLKCVERGQVMDQDVLRDFANSLDVLNREGHQFVMAKEACDLDELSTSDVKVLDYCIESYRDVAPFSLADISHDSAWQRAKKEAERTGERARIPLCDIAKAGGASAEMLKVIRDRQWTEYSLS